MSTTYKQILQSKSGLESLLASARSMRDQWLASSRENPTNLTKKEIDHIAKAFKNKILEVKWDCEDLEELLSAYEHENIAPPSRSRHSDETSGGGGGGGASVNIDEIRQYIGACRDEFSGMMMLLDEAESSSRLFNKHGITFPNHSGVVSSMLASPVNKYERLSNQVHDVEDVQFDKSLVAPSGGGAGGGASIVNNMLYDHLESSNSNNDHERYDRNSFSNSSQVFNNLSRPVTTNVYMNPNENEIILDMLETEYYNPPAGLLKKSSSSRVDGALRKLFETNRSRLLGTVVFLFSFPILLILIMFA